MKKSVLFMETTALLAAAALCGCSAKTQETTAAAETTVAETTAAETTEAQTSAAVESKIETYESQDGWKLSYDTAVIKMDENADGVSFTYTGESDGEHSITISYIPKKQPEEVLWEKTERYNPQDVQRNEGYFAGVDNWSFSAQIKPDGPKANVNEGYTAVEHNGGVLLISTISAIESDEGRAMGISDTMAELLDSFEFTNHDPQTEYAYVPGCYVRIYEEEFDGNMQKFAESFALNADHSGSLNAQDTITLYWTSTELVMDGTNERHEYTIEGDTLLVETSGEWVSYEKANVLKTLPGAFTMENLSDCMPNVEFNADDIDWKLNCLYAMIYDVENFDMVDVAKLKVGDVIETANGDIVVKTLEDVTYGKLINADEEDQLVLQPLEEGSGVYQIVGFDDVREMELLGQAQLTLADNVVLHDCTDQPGEVVDVKADELQAYIDSLPENRRDFHPDCTTVTIEKDLVTEITRSWRP